MILDIAAVAVPSSSLFEVSAGLICSQITKGMPMKSSYLMEISSQSQSQTQLAKREKTKFKKITENRDFYDSMGYSKIK